MTSENDDRNDKDLKQNALGDDEKSGLPILETVKSRF